MRRIKYKKYAGVRVRGTLNDGSDLPVSTHIERASWLTAMVESGGKFGTVISYDGTGMTAGIHQAIAVYPKELSHPDGYPLDDQGPLWKLLDRCFQAYAGNSQFSGYDSLYIPAVSDMQDALLHAGILVSNGVARDATTGKVIFGNVLRELFTGSADGVMPARGKGRERAEMWAALFSTMFSDYRTYDLQLRWGEEKLIKRIERTKLRYASAPYWRGRTPQEVFYTDEYPVGTVTFGEEHQKFDLAMCVWLSYSVNAPAIALKKLCRVIPVHHKHGDDAFAKALINAIGNSRWGRWDDDIKNGRYQRTRKYAMKLWPKELFVGSDAIMPKNLVG